MFHLLVVDDEEYAREGVMRAIDWESIGIGEIRGAEDAEEAKRTITAHTVDVIVCDIEMSQESGLDFMQWLLEQNCPAKVIFLTAYAKFEYAQRAIKLGAFDFLVKPTDHGALKEKVRQALAVYEEERKNRYRMEEYEQFQREWNRMLPDLRNRYWFELLLRPSASADAEQMERMMRLYRIPTEAQAMALLLVHREEEEEDRPSLGMLRLCRLANELLLRGDGDAVVVDREHLAVLYYDEASFCSERVETFLAQAGEKLGGGVEPEALAVKGIEHIAIHSVFQALRAAENTRSLAEGFLVYSGRQMMERQESVPEEEVLTACLVSGNRKQLERMIAGILESLNGRGDCRETLTIFYYRFLTACIRTLHEQGRMVQGHGKEYYSEQVCGDPERFRGWAQRWIDEVIPEDTIRRMPAMIDRVQAYIRENIGGELSRESIARHVYLNPSYLSRLFHQETGEKLSEYILRMRIRKAQELLLTTEEKISRIAAAVGYSDDSYFIRNFKAFTGRTPQEYRREQGR